MSLIILRPLAPTQTSIDAIVSVQGPYIADLDEG
jgi:hypothetical protein